MLFEPPAADKRIELTDPPGGFTLIAVGFLQVGRIGHPQGKYAPEIDAIGNTFSHIMPNQVPKQETRFPIRCSIDWGAP